MSFISTRAFTTSLSLLGLVWLAEASIVSVQDAPLTPYRAEYDVYRNGKLLGSSRIELVRDGDTWRYGGDTTGDRGMASFLGVKIAQDLEFRWRDGLPQPIRSNYRQDAAITNRTVNVSYDWNTGRYRLVDRKGEHDHPLQPGTADRYGSGISIAAKLAQGATDFSLPIAYPDGVRQWRFRAVGKETVTTPAGTVQALKIERVRDDDDRTTVSWHDPARNYAIVRLIQEEDGDTTETQLQSYLER